MEFTLSDHPLSVVDAEGVRRIEPGNVEVWIGGGQPPTSAGAKTQFATTGRVVL